MNIIPFQHMVLSKFIPKKWKNNSKLKESKTSHPLKLSGSLTGCMNQPFSTSSPILAFSSPTQSPKSSVFGKRTSDTENFSKLERNLFLTHFLPNLHFLIISCKSTGVYSTCSKTEPSQAEYLKIELGRRLILILNKKPWEKRPRLNMKIS